MLAAEERTEVLSLGENIVELLGSGKIAALREELKNENVVDIAVAVSELETEDLLRVFRILPKDISADVFSYLDSDDQARLVESITDKELEQLLDEMYLDDTVDFIEEVPANIVKRVLARSDSKTRSLINKFLQYPENSAGSIMTIEYVELHDYFTAQQAVDYIRHTGYDKETVYNCFCIDHQRHLIGTVALEDLLFCKADTPIKEIMDVDDSLISVSTSDDQEYVADIAKKYDLLSVPVVDNEKRLVGIITIDDIIDVMEDEATEDIEKMNLLLPSDDEYLKTSVFTMAKNRIVWLLVLMISATFTGQIIANFEDKLSAIAGLTACIPMLMDTGGNAGNQVSTLIIRGLALGEVRPKDYFKVLWKELRVALICGVLLAIVNFGRMFVIRAVTHVATPTPVFFVVCAAMIFAVMVAKIIGCTLPIIAKLLHLDPALMAGPMITTIVDAVTLLIYFALANRFLTFA
ncbi:MAG: magnesium transporter [Clostridiales bacterium]|nr:magnesium transporter [Clostridiales bacterium]